METVPLGCLQMNQLKDRIVTLLVEKQSLEDEVERLRSEKQTLVKDLERLQSEKQTLLKDHQVCLRNLFNDCLNCD